MRTRVRKYVSVVMALVLCFGMWFQYGQTVQAEETLAVMVYINDNKLESGVKTEEVSVVEGEGSYSYTGTITLDGEQIKDENGYFIYWYTTGSGNVEIATGASPTIELSKLAENGMLNCKKNDDESYEVTVSLYANYGASHTVRYYTNEQMDGLEKGTLEQEITYYQKAVEEKGQTYEHPVQPQNANSNNLFIGWGTAMSGGVDAPSEFKYGDQDLELYAIWKETLPSGSTISAGTVTLQADTPYVLESGSWTVTDGTTKDSCVYAGGSTFYVTQTGDYIFTTN